MNRTVVKKNLIMMLTAAGVLLLTALVCYFITRSLGDYLNQLRMGISETRSRGEVGDVEGYGILASGAAYMVGGFAYMVLHVVLVVLPTFFGTWLLIFTLSAWIVAVKANNLTAYRVLMGINFGGLILMEIIVCGFVFMGSIFLVPMAGALGAVLFFGIRNTYTKRLKEN